MQEEVSSQYDQVLSATWVLQPEVTPMSRCWSAILAGCVTIIRHRGPSQARF